MPKKTLINYICNSCGANSSSWSGRCFNCGEWNTLEEQINLSKSDTKGKILHTLDINSSLSSDLPRLKTGLEEVDKVLGGGFVAGSVVLLAGEPGIGKSTLTLQLANKLASNKKVIYVSGEESAHQIGLRAKRLGIRDSNLQLATSNSANDIAETITSKSDMIIIDSVQSISCNEVSSSPGTVSQITSSTNLIMSSAKSTNTSVVLVGHVTKEGSIAGPKILEHMVDVVLQLEGDRHGGFKLLRSAKNRYGSTNETGILEMLEKGFTPVDNPSAALLAERQINDGSIVLATIEGSRPILVEVQALVNKTNYGYPKRASSGIDSNRVNLLIAMLERRTKLKLTDSDIYVNIVGGVRVNEPAADLAVCMAIASAAKGMKLKNDAVVFGEVGLAGEIRHVTFLEKRIEEAAKLGFKTTIGPKSAKVKVPGYHGMSDIKTTLNTFLGKE